MELQTRRRPLSPLTKPRTIDLWPTPARTRFVLSVVWWPNLQVLLSHENKVSYLCQTVAILITFLLLLPGHPVTTQLHHSVWQPKHRWPRFSVLWVVPQPREQRQSGGDAGTILHTAEFTCFGSVDKIIVANSGICCAFQGVRTPILQLSAMQEGDYTFQLTVTDSAGQQDTSQVTVIVQPGKQLESSCHLSRYHFPAITDVTH